jgi:hypothetical protein
MSALHIVHLMKDFTTIKTLLAKLAFKKLCAKADCSVEHYQADNSQFSDNKFLAACNNLNQTIEFCGAGAHHQIGIIENKNKQLTQTASVLLLHGTRMWPQMLDQMFSLFAIKAAAERMNSLQIDTEVHTPESKFYSVNIENIPVKPLTQCSVYVTVWTVDSTTRVQLDHKNGNQDHAFMYILDTLRFMPEVLHLSTTHPLDMSAHSTMLSLTTTSQRYHTWKQE